MTASLISTDHSAKMTAHQTIFSISFLVVACAAFFWKNILESSSSSAPLLVDTTTGTWKQIVDATRGNQTDPAANNLASFFERGTANVRWCEDVVAGHHYHESIAEFYNTITNIAFIIAALLGLKRVYDSRKPEAISAGRPSLSNAFVLSEMTMLIGVGFGSMLFHAHQSRFSQWADEVPMSVLAAVYL
jgi:hypothetical protein